MAKFRTQYTYDPSEDVEVNSGEDIVDRTGVVSIEESYNTMLQAGLQKGLYLNAKEPQQEPDEVVISSRYTEKVVFEDLHRRLMAKHRKNEDQVALLKQQAYEAEQAEIAEYRKFKAQQAEASPPPSTTKNSDTAPT